MKLYHYSRSSASFRVRIALNLKNISYEDVPIHLLNNGGEQFSEQFQKINPQNLVPVLQHDEKMITQSLAIIEYLDEIQPTPPLLPKDSYQKARVKAFALAIAADIHPLNNLRVLQYLRNELSVTEEKKLKWYRHWIAKGFSALEKIVADNKNDFCFGHEPTLADVFLVPQMVNARRYECDVSLYPNLVRVDANCQALPAFKKAWPVES